MQQRRYNETFEKGQLCHKGHFQNIRQLKISMEQAMSHVFVKLSGIKSSFFELLHLPHSIVHKKISMQKNLQKSTSSYTWPHASFLRFASGIDT